MPLVILMLAALGIFAPAPVHVPAHASATSPKQQQEQVKALVQSQSQSQQLASGQPEQAATPLERVLNKDGTLKLSTGFSGSGSVSIDPKGWRMETEPDGKPRFVKSYEQQHPTANPRSTNFSPFLPLAPGDENWDDRFDTLGMNDDVRAIVITGTDVYVGGWFTTAGGVPANNIAKWDGSSWSALGSGVGTTSDFVHAIVSSGSDVYVGGAFGTAGGLPANGIAKWNGSTWSALGSISGVGAVNAIVIRGSDVYVGGRGSIAGTLAKWNGSTWSTLGSVNGGMYPSIEAIALSGSDVYAGGRFTTAGGVPANRIAKWDGSTSSWSPLGSGVSNASTDPRVWALASSGSDVHVGGTSIQQASIHLGISGYGIYHPRT